jgi:hypothetical protein
MPYLLDANILIQAKQQYYDFKTCPGFWDWLEEQHSEGNVFSREMVYDEIEAFGDELSSWAKNLKQSFFLAVDHDTNEAMKDVVATVASGSFELAAQADFLNCADPFLIACAKAKNLILVTHEKPNRPEQKRKVKIPTICQAVSVKYCNTFEMLGRENVAFKL